MCHILVTVPLHQIFNFLSPGMDYNQERCFHFIAVCLITVNLDNHCIFPFSQQRISHLVGLLSDGGKPVLLVGEAGCGKTSILRHRLKQHGGDIGEVLSLTVFCNKFTTSRSLWREMSSCLEWKHARTFVPKGNKRLTCLVDDLNLSRVSAEKCL